MYHKILVPLDGSKRADRILPHVEELARRYKAKVIFLQVIEYMPLGEILTYQNDGTFRRKEPKKGEARIEGGDMTIGVGKAEEADVIVNGTITDLFVNAEEPLDLVADDERSSLQGFMHAFALQHRSGHLLVW